MIQARKALSYLLQPLVLIELGYKSAKRRLLLSYLEKQKGTSQ